jgi:serine/threonine protein kinase
MSRPKAVPSLRNDIPVGDGRSLRLEAPLGRGTLATVYRATYEGPFDLRRPVALKVFDSLASDDRDSVFGALGRVVRQAARVQHPNVVGVQDFGNVAPGRPYVVSELVEGRTLTRLIARVAQRAERIPLDVALFVALEVAEGLAGARVACGPDGGRLGLVHGALGPGDVLLSWHGEVRVTDFGIAGVAQVSSGVRTFGAVAHRVRALAPEVVRGKMPDARSDVFSLGVLLHELLIGPRFPPFVSEHQALAWAREGLVHRRAIEPYHSEEVRAVIARAIELEPDRRYPHAGALAAELRNVVTAMGVGDGRMFLRSALARAFDGEREDDATGELRAPRVLGGADRFARLRGELAEDTDPDGLESGLLPVGSTPDDDDA